MVALLIFLTSTSLPSVADASPKPTPTPAVSSQSTKVNPMVNMALEEALSLLLIPASPTGSYVNLVNATDSEISDSATNSPSAVLSLKQAGLPATAASEYSSASSALETIFKAGLPKLLAAATAVETATTANLAIHAAITKATGGAATTTTAVMATATAAGVAAMAAATAAGVSVKAAAMAAEGAKVAAMGMPAADWAKDESSWASSWASTEVIEAEEAGSFATDAADLSAEADMYDATHVLFDLLSQLHVQEIPWLRSYSAFASELAATYALTHTGTASFTLSTTAASYSAALSAYVSSPTLGMLTTNSAGVAFRTAAADAAGLSADYVSMAGGSSYSVPLADIQALNQATQTFQIAQNTQIASGITSPEFLLLGTAHLALSNAAKEVISTLTQTPAAKMTPLSAVVPKLVIKKATITCVSGKLSRTVTALKPICPKGYKKK